MSRWLAGLNPEQRQAVTTVEGPLLVLAGAGSGKTRVITHRIAYLLENGVAGENVLAVTFTNKAADEMRERLRGMVGARASAAVTMSTFHALGLSMLRQEAARGRQRARFVVFDAGDQLACLREIARRLRLGRNFDLGSVLSRISAYKNEFVDPAALPYSDDPYVQAAAAFFPAYQEALAAYAAYDFDDLICEPTRRMETEPACRQRWAKRFRFVLVDEYQDTNGAQLRMLRAIAGVHRNLCVVGDDDQSIYGWRGAQVRNILQFARDFPGTRTVSLMRNYRSVPAVLAVANAVIAANEQRHPKHLQPVRESGAPVRLVVLEDGDAEAAWVAERCVELLAGGRRPSELAVLYRSNLLARGLEASLRGLRLPYRVLGGRSFFERKEVKDVVAYLRLLVQPGDALSLRRVINTPPRGIGPTTVARLAEWAERHDRPMMQALEEATGVLPAGDRALPAVAAFLELLRRGRAQVRRGADLVAAVEALLQATGLQRDVTESSSSGEAAERRWAGVEDMLDTLRAYCARTARADLGEFLSGLALVEREDDADEGPGERITLSTLHGAKGLEWPVVFVAGLEEGLLPHDRVLNPHANDAVSGDLAEERRLCYVGVTRARDELILTRAARRLFHGQQRDRAPSRFLQAIDPGLLSIEDRTAPVSLEDARTHLAQILAGLK